jgi:hypothetical protein
VRNGVRKKEVGKMQERMEGHIDCSAGIKEQRNMWRTVRGLICEGME